MFSIEKNVKPLSISTIHGQTKVTHSTRMTPIDLKAKFPIRFHLFKFHNYFDGLIGSDFLKLLKVDICYSDQTIKTPDAQMRILFHSTGPKLSNFVAKANSETKIKLKVAPNTPKNMILPEYKFTENCMVPSCLTTNINGEVTVLVRNNSNEDVRIAQKDYLYHFDADMSNIGSSKRSKPIAKR